jgi:gamma-glutamylaminecyclotransferase
MNTTIFVYGTLKRGQRNNEMLFGQQFLGPAQTLPHYRLYDCGRHPALVDNPENGVAVRGEVWQVSEETLHKLDEYEGVPDYFSRRPISLQGWDSPVEAYFFNGDVTHLKDCGDDWPPEDKIENRI